MICTLDAPSASSARADGADAAVHHVGGRDDVAAGLGLHQRLAHQHLDGLVVDDVAVVASGRRGRGWCRGRAPRRAARRCRGSALRMARVARQTRLSGLSASRPVVACAAWGRCRERARQPGCRAPPPPRPPPRQVDAEPARRRASRRPARVAPRGPRRTNIGQIRSAGVSSVSATSRRAQAYCRLRRMRTAGKLPDVACSALAEASLDAGWRWVGGFIAVMAHPTGRPAALRPVLSPSRAGRPRRQGGGAGFDGAAGVQPALATAQLLFDTQLNVRWMRVRQKCPVRAIPIALGQRPTAGERPEAEQATLLP